MEQLNAKEIAEAVGGTIVSGEPKTVITDVTTDSRKVNDHTLFIPLKGENADGHDYIDKAVGNGVPMVLTHRDVKLNSSVCVIRIDDTLKALGQLAKYYLKVVDVKVVAVTGSVGKTSTKEMIASVLSERYRVVKTQGNYNNHIGLPLTIFRLTKQDEIAVLEMGMNHFGEIDYLADIAEPDVAVITNIGVSHIENLGSREGILKSKMEINEHLKENGKLILNADNDMLRTIIPKVRDHAVTYSVNENDGDLVATNVESTPSGIKFDVEIGDNVYHSQIPTIGDYHVYNALCALCVGSQFGMTPSEMMAGISHYENTGMRMCVKPVKDYTLIVDCYNAAPDSMKSAIKALSEFKEKRHIAILGDMLEMGFYAPTAHKEVGKAVADHAVDLLMTIGEEAKNIAIGAVENGFPPQNVYVFANNGACMEHLERLLQSEDVILLKASRGMALEEILQYLER